MGRKLYKKEKFDNFKDWHASRGIGGSSASALFNENKYQTKLDIYCAMTAKPNERVETAEDLEGDDNSATIRGKKLEPIIRELIKTRLGKKFRIQTPNGFTMYRRKDKPYMTATLDGILIDKKTGERWVLEIKTHSDLGHEDMANWDKQLPQNYFIQVAHYLAVLNDFVGVYVVADILHDDFDTEMPRTAESGCGDEIRYYKQTREKMLKDIELVEEVETEFIEHNVAKRIPPNFSF